MSDPDRNIPDWFEITCYVACAVILITATRYVN